MKGSETMKSNVNELIQHISISHDIQRLWESGYVGVGYLIVFLMYIVSTAIVSSIYHGNNK